MPAYPLQAMNRELRIGQAARELGVSTKHLKLLERHGRIPPARRDQYGGRIYSDFDLAVLRGIGVGERPRRLKTFDEVLR